MNFSEENLSVNREAVRIQPENQQLLLNVALLPCDVHAEWGNFLTEICVNKNCRKNFKSCCNDCRRAEHDNKNHYLKDFISIKKFLGKLNQLPYNSLTCQKYQDLLKPQLEQLNKKSKELLIKIDQLKDQLQQTIAEIVKLVGEEQDYTKKQQKELEIFRSKHNEFIELKTRNSIDEYLKVMQPLVNITNVIDGDFTLELKSAETEKMENEVKIKQRLERCKQSSENLISIDTKITNATKQFQKINQCIVKDGLSYSNLKYSKQLATKTGINKRCRKRSDSDEDDEPQIQSKIHPLQLEVKEEDQ